MKIIRLTALALVLSAFASQASASIVVASNDFQSTSTPGWNFAKGTSKYVADPKDASNKVLQFTGNSATAVTHGFESHDSDLMVSFDFSYSGVMSVNTFMGVSFGGLMSSPSIGIKSDCDDNSGKCKNDVFVRMGETGTVMMLNSDLAADTNYTIFGRLYKDNGSATYNRFDAWLNPSTNDLLTLTGADASATGKTSITSVNTLGVRTANIDTKSTLRIDNLEVSEVPEPGSLSLIGLALAGFAFSRRKRA